MTDAERTEVHSLVDYLLSVAANDRDGFPPLMGEAVGKLAREVARLRTELEERTNELHWVQRELADAQKPFAQEELDEGDYERYGAAFIEALGIAERAGRRGLLSRRETERLRELGKVVPQ